MIAFADDRFVPVTLVCEFSSEPEEAAIWGMWVLHNRTKDPRFHPKLAQVCVQRMQLSEFNDDKADNENLLRGVGLETTDPQIVRAVAVYQQVLADIAAGKLDPTGGATHWVDDRAPPPSWAIAPAVMTGHIGHTKFYANVH